MRKDVLVRFRTNILGNLKNRGRLIVNVYANAIRKSCEGGLRWLKLLEMVRGKCTFHSTFTVIYKHKLFYHRATACNATHGIAVAILSLSFCPSVCLSDACVVTKRNNRMSISQHHTKRGYLSLSIPTGVAGSCPLPPEIFVESDPPPSKNADFDDRFPVITPQP